MKITHLLAILLCIAFISIECRPVKNNNIYDNRLQQRLEEIETFLNPKKRKQHYKKQAKKNSQKIIRNVCYHRMHLMF